MTSELNGGTVSLFTDSQCLNSVAISSSSFASDDISFDLDSSNPLLIDGINSYYAILTDNVGLASNCSEVASYTYDTVSPSTTFSYSIGGNDIKIGSDTSVQLAGACEDNLDIQINIGTQNSTIECIGGNYTSDVFNLTSENDGDISVNIHQTDLAGNTTTLSDIVKKDVVPPTAISFNSTTQAKLDLGLTKEMCMGNACIVVTSDSIDNDTKNIEIYTESSLVNLEGVFTATDLSSGYGISLTPNSSNTKYLVPIDELGNRGPISEINIVHDNIAPTTPTLGVLSTALNGDTTSMYVHNLDLLYSSDSETISLYDENMNELQSMSKEEFEGEGEVFEIIASIDIVNTYYMTTKDSALNESLPVEVTFTHDAVLPVINGNPTVSSNSGSDALVNINNRVIINPNTTGTITLPTGSSPMGFNIKSHSVDLTLSPSVFNCTNTSEENPTEIICEYDFSGKSAPLTETINYSANEEYNAVSGIKTIILELNEGPQ